MDIASLHVQTMKYRMYVKWQKLKTALTLKPSVQM